MNKSPEMQRYQVRMAEAREKFSELAANLQLILRPIDVVGTLMGPAVGILEHYAGRPKAAEYLRLLADEIERTDSGEVAMPDLLN